MKARDLFEVHGAPAPTVEPPTKKPEAPTKEPAAPPRREPKFPNPFRRRERPTVVPKPKACYRPESKRATVLVDELLEVKLYAQRTPPYKPEFGHGSRMTCPKCGKPKSEAKLPCPTCEPRSPGRSVTTPPPPNV